MRFDIVELYPVHIEYEEAIIGLAAAMIMDITYVDTIAAIINSFVIIKWAIRLLRESGKVLITKE